MFDESEKGPFELPPGRTNKGYKYVPDAPKLYGVCENISAGVFCSLLFVFYFIGNKIAIYHFKDEIKPLLKSNDRLKFAQDVVVDSVQEKVKPRSIFHIKYLMNKIYMIHCFTHIYFQH